MYQNPMPVKKRFPRWAIILLIVGGLFWIFVIASMVNGGEPTASPETTVETTSNSPEPFPTVNSSKPPQTNTQLPKAKSEVELTSGQKNAIGAARDYLDYSAFSRKGLIKQLQYEGYSSSDASFAVDHINADWNDQAVKSAKDYLEYDNFSRLSLINQLEYEGFTSAQAKYGVDKAGL